MINNKYKLSEVAKDLGVEMKDVAQLLEQHFPGEKKRTTVLTNQELNLIFETYTQQHQMDNLDSYYAYKEQSQPVQEVKKPAKKAAKEAPKPKSEPAAEVPMAPKASKEEPAAAEVPKAPKAPKQEPAAAEAPKAPEAPQQEALKEPTSHEQQPEVLEQPAAPKQERVEERETEDMNDTPKQHTQGPRAQGDRPQGERKFNDRSDRPERKFNDRPARSDRPQGERKFNDRSDRPQGERKFNDRSDRPQGERKFNDRGDRPQGERRFNDRQDRSNAPRQQQKPAKQPPKPAAPRQASAINPELDENVNGKMIRHVDMRAANVDLDKYNERYENIAPENLAKRDDGVKKQKIGGRNNKKKNFMSKKDKEMERCASWRWSASAVRSCTSLCRMRSPSAIWL